MEETIEVMTEKARGNHLVASIFPTMTAILHLRGTGKVSQGDY